MAVRVSVPLVYTIPGTDTERATAYALEQASSFLHSSCIENYFQAMYEEDFPDIEPDEVFVRVGELVAAVVEQADA